MLPLLVFWDDDIVAFTITLYIRCLLLYDCLVWAIVLSVASAAELASGAVGPPLTQYEFYLIIVWNKLLSLLLEWFFYLRACWWWL